MSDFSILLSVGIFTFALGAYRIATYRTIKKRGIKGVAVLIDFNVPTWYGGKLNIFSLGYPKFRFYLEGREMFANAPGFFMREPFEIGEEVGVYWWYKKPDYVVMEGSRFEIQHALSIAAFYALILVFLLSVNGV